MAERDFSFGYLVYLTGHVLSFAERPITHFPYLTRLKKWPANEEGIINS